MLLTFEDRLSDSPLVERVWRSHSARAGEFTSVAASTWEMVVTRLHGETTLTVRGPETRPTSAFAPADGEWLGIRFKVGTFMPQLPIAHIRDRKDVTLPQATKRAFWLDGAAWEYPTFENAEAFVARLVRVGRIGRDPVVDDVVRGRPQALSTRTAQRRFVRATGLTHGAFRQIERARRAAYALAQGAPILEAVDTAGYYDQAHLTRALRRWIGRTPGEIARGEEQLSFLYKTTPS
jgi:AraC-like DNA-binding protein